MELLYGVIATILGIFGFSYLTNPFSRWTIIRRHYRAELIKQTLTVINENHQLTVSNNRFMKSLAIINNGIYIVSSRWHQRPTSSADSVEGIIDDIYRLRFNPHKLLLTSGDHFSSLFVRNLGVSYYPVLDTHLPTTESKWQARQATYIQTLAYALGVFEHTEDLSTTIVPTGRSRATCVNFHSYPSDTLYGMLFALAALFGKQKAYAVAYGREQAPLDCVRRCDGTYQSKRYDVRRKRYHDAELGVL